MKEAASERLPAESAVDDIAEERNARAATAPISPTTKSPERVPYSEILKARKAAAAATAKAAHASNHRWSGTTSESNEGASSATGPGVGGGRKLTPRQLLKKYKAKIKPRTYLYTLFAFVEVVMFMAFMLSARASSHAVDQNYVQAASDALSGVHEAYTKKVFQMRNLLQNTIYNFDVQQFLLNTTSEEHQLRMSRLMSHISAVYQIETITILDTNKNVVMCLNRNHTGEPFDPEGIVTEAERVLDRPVWTYSWWKYEDFILEHPPLYRDRESELDQAFKGNHPYETKEDALIRWVAIAIQEVDVQTFELVDENAPPNGYFVVGDLVNGKSSTTSLVGLTMGGLAGVYHEQRVHDQGTHVDEIEESSNWLTASVSLNAKLEAWEGSYSTIQNVLVQGFSPYDASPGKDEWFEAAEQRGELDMSCLNHRVDPYLLSMRKWHIDDEAEPTGLGRPALVLSRGLLTDTAFTTTFMMFQWIRLAIIVAMDMLTLLMATWLFLAPLEAMGRRIRAGQRVDINFLKSLTNRRQLGLGVAAVAIFSVLVGFDMRNANARNLNRMVSARSSVEPGTGMLAYRQGMDQASRIMATMQWGSGLLGLLNDTSDMVRFEFAHGRLEHLEASLWVEFALMFDGGGKLLVAPNNRDMEGRTDFDPVGIVNATLSSGLKYMRSSLQKVSDIRNFKVQTWDDHYFNTTADSKLHPNNIDIDPSSEVLVRWMSCPMWIDGPDSLGPPSGALLIGDIVNGKTRIVERANKMASHGYTAIYYYNSNGTYQLAAGIMRSADGAFDVDVELPATNWLDKLRLSERWLTDDHAAVTTRLNFAQYGDASYVISARCLNKNTYLESYGAVVELTDWNGELAHDCLGYLIQGLPWADVKPIIAPSNAWQWVFVTFCIIKMIALLLLCYRAYKPFSAIIVNNKFVQGAGAASPQKSGTSKTPLPIK
eukprot:TRINITY_DN13326_c0_g1_i1.p1 TRINITY_DN13326_c0_g1~~TRINITY_DN13326_c0_g1_i1.p1  ORF type:complete len:940 (-),score=218.52 TRINITY_DN13326_c0_g1_i1:433-3252(-)